MLAIVWRLSWTKDVDGYLRTEGEVVRAEAGRWDDRDKERRVELGGECDDAFL